MKLTILMYHKIDEQPPGVRTPGNFVSPARFAEQMDALLSWGYQTITFDQWLDHVNELKVPIPKKPLIVTFDDGYTCFDANAWPVLRARKMGATVFLVAGQIGGSNTWERDEVRMPLLGADRIRALQNEGVHFGSHSVTHKPLARIPREDAFQELARSRWILTELLGSEVDCFAYPFSNQSAEVRALARQAGYRCAVRGKGRMNSSGVDPFGLRRIKVEPETTVQSLKRTLFRERFLRAF
jgi:peptidoglycan/xylan/chitin deacetylase (PgdA/CDA1 family)